MRTATPDEALRFGVRVGSPIWEPFPAQKPFLYSNAREALYGGAAGGGKTDALVMGALQGIQHPKYVAIVFRRTYPELKGKVIPVSKEWYPLCGGRYHETDHTWTFPSGSRIIFGHMQREDDARLYQGLEFQYIGFDELTHFLESQYVFLGSRLRSAGVSETLPLRIRSGTNPGGPGAEWVQRRWAPWLDKEYKGQRANPGEAMWFVGGRDGERWITDNDERKRLLERWESTPIEQRKDLPEGKPFTRVFFPALASDNPYLSADYIAQLMSLDPVTRAQQLHGDWMARPAAGAYFQRAWFKFVDVAPVDARATVRRWDLASTEDGDWTVGVRMHALKDGGWLIDDVVRLRARPAGVRQTVLETARMDGKRCRVVIPQDPGQAGVAQMEDYTRALAGYDVRSPRETGDKVVRAQPFSAQVEAGNVMLLRAPWNEPFLQSLEAFPDPGVHDDDVDAAAGAFTALQEKETAAMRWARLAERR